MDPMVRFTKRLVAAALMTFYIMSLLVLIPNVSAASQTITDLGAPDEVEFSERFLVTVRVSYEFGGEDARVWARVRSQTPLGDVSAPLENAKTVRGGGELTWNFEITAPNVAGVWTLEAYAFHWDSSNREVVDDTKEFRVDVVAPIAKVTTTQLARTSTQAIVTSRLTSVVTTQAVTRTTGGLGGGGAFLILLIVAVVAGAAYYVSRRRKVNPPSAPQK
jgi:hypothetical protein